MVRKLYTQLEQFEIGIYYLILQYKTNHYKIVSNRSWNMQQKMVVYDRMLSLADKSVCVIYRSFIKQIKWHLAWLLHTLPSQGLPRSLANSATQGCHRKLAETEASDCGLVRTPPTLMTHAAWWLTRKAVRALGGSDQHGCHQGLVTQHLVPISSREASLYMSTVAVKGQDQPFTWHLRMHARLRTYSARNLILHCKYEYQ